MQTLLMFVTGYIVVTNAFPNCPYHSDFKPCTCDGEGFNCRRAKDDTALTQAMKAYAEEDVVRALFIQGTPIKRLSAGVFGRFKFGEVHIDANQIATIEPGVFAGSKDTMYAISLYRNQLVNFPFKDIAGLPYLQIINLAKNKLTAIPGPSAFGTHQNLRQLLLSSNNIAQIGRGAFSGLPALHVLELSDNKLVALESQAFYMANYFQQLQIGLNNNSIARIASDAFGNTTPLIIGLQNNRLTSIPQIPFKTLMTGNIYVTVDVTGNPLTCQGCPQYRWILDKRHILQHTLLGFVCTDKRILNSLTLRNIGC